MIVTNSDTGLALSSTSTSSHVRIVFEASSTLAIRPALLRYVKHVIARLGFSSSAANMDRNLATHV